MKTFSIEENLLYNQIMPKDSGKYLIIALSALFIILFVYIFSGRRDKSELVLQNRLSSDLSGKIDVNKKIGYWHEKKIDIPLYLMENDAQKVLSLVPRDERWVEVDLSDQKLTAWENGKVFLETLVSTGLPWWPTPTGEFYVWLKSRAVTMEGGEGRYYYNLPNVPYVMFFENDEVPRSRGFGLHGTYWHNDFGTVHSHGCVNLPTEIAKELYFWTYPILSNNIGSVYSDENNPGTKIIIHE